jgi:integrase/recombinase XerD
MTTIKEAVTDFILHCQHEKKLSSKTQKCYEIDLTQFLDFLVKENYQQIIEQIDKHTLRQYLHSLANFKPKTIKRKIATLKAFFNFMEFEDKIVVNPFRKIRFQIKEPKRLPTVMTELEIQKIFKAVYSKRDTMQNQTVFGEFETMRNIAVIELLFATGVRVSELSNLSEDNIDLKAGHMKVIGKGNKERIIQICNQEMISAIEQYANISKKYRNDSTNSFFVNRLGKQLSEQSIRYVVKNLSRLSELNKRITPHVFRHSIATLLLEQGVDIKYIQVLLGHSSIMTTQIYTHVNGEKQKEILSAKHPRKNFSMALE